VEHAADVLAHVVRIAFRALLIGCLVVDEPLVRLVPDEPERVLALVDRLVVPVLPTRAVQLAREQVESVPLDGGASAVADEQVDLVAHQDDIPGQPRVVGLGQAVQAAGVREDDGIRGEGRQHFGRLAVLVVAEPDHPRLVALGDNVADAEAEPAGLAHDAGALAAERDLPVVHARLVREGEGKQSGDDQMVQHDSTPNLWFLPEA
jgi:hypothetical protein